MDRLGNYVELTLMNGFELRHDGLRVGRPLAAQRLVAFLALHERPLQRLYVAGKLWPDGSDERALACLRSTLWRVNRDGVMLVQAHDSRLALDPGVRVDVRELARASRAVTDREQLPATDVFSGELLPDWYDEWLALERERVRQLCLHALEGLADALLAAGRFADAADAALAAIAGEPLRESGHRALVRIHLAEGNASEAIRAYEAFRHLLGDALGLPPSAAFTRLVGGVTGEYAAVTAPVHISAGVV